jgi:pimeloyl-ACP methyl ester carboxylesterase
VHGGLHSARCWEPTVAELARRFPALQVLAVDLPGRGSNPGDLGTLTIDQCAESVVDQVNHAGMRNVVLVGHSLAGVTLPRAAARLGEARVDRMVFVTCCIPPEGGTVIDTLSGPARVYARRAAGKKQVVRPMPRPLARWLFCNGMTREQKAFVIDQLCDEAMVLTSERVDRSTMPREVPRTWVLTQRDRSLRPPLQRTFIENLGGVEEVVELDTCHDVMVSDPGQLAEVLAVRCKARLDGEPANPA